MAHSTSASRFRRREHAQTTRLSRLRSFVHRNWPVLAVGGGALVLIVIAYVFFASEGQVLRYADGRAKLNMARRLYDSQTPGFGQIGGVWLPLPVLLMSLLAWIKPLYYTGLAGSLWAMLAFALTAMMLFSIGRRLAGPLAGLCAVVLFAANPHILYIYTTPMTEPLLVTAIVAVLWRLQRLEDDPSRTANLIGLAGVTLLCTLIRYEGWLLLGAVTAFVALIYLRSRRGLGEVQARTLSFVALASQGVVLWLLWETIIFGNPLYFATSKYSAHVIDVEYYGYTDNVGRLGASIQTYLGAMQLHFPIWLLVATVIGLGVQFVLLFYRNARGKLAPFILAAVPLFFVLSLYRGQAAIYLGDLRADDSTDWHYNIRYALIAAPLVVVFAGLAVATLMKGLQWVKLGRLGYAAPVVLAAAMLYPFVPRIPNANLELLYDRGAVPSTTRDAMGLWLREHYDTGNVMMEVFKNNDIVFGSRVPQRRFITEANLELWEAALTNPAEHARWVVMGGRADDAVRNRLGESPAFHQQYELVYEAKYKLGDEEIVDGVIYRLRAGPTAAKR